MDTHTTTHLTDDELVLHYYGEMEAAGETRAADHLTLCEGCRTNYATLQRVFAVVDHAAAVEAPAGFERIAWARLEPALPTRGGGWLSWSLFSPTRLAFAAGIVLCVAAAFFAGRLAPRAGALGPRADAPGPRASAPAPSAVSASAAAAAAVRERVLLVDLGEHLDRSQIVLVEIVSAGGGGSVDISTEQARAQQLLADNRLYRQTAAKTGDAGMASVLDELERVLVDIAASPSKLSQEDLDTVQRRIESKGLLFKVRVVSSEVRERQKAAIAERTGQRSPDTTKG